MGTYGQFEIFTLDASVQPKGSDKLAESQRPVQIAARAIEADFHSAPLARASVSLLLLHKRSKRCSAFPFYFSSRQDASFADPTDSLARPNPLECHGLSKSWADYEAKNTC